MCSAVANATHPSDVKLRLTVFSCHLDFGFIPTGFQRLALGRGFRAPKEHSKFYHAPLARWGRLPSLLPQVRETRPGANGYNPCGIKTKHDRLAVFRENGLCCRNRNGNTNVVEI